MPIKEPTQSTPNDPDDVDQLARYMQARDARIFGFHDDAGLWHPTWEETGLAQEEYVKDADFYLHAVQLLGYLKTAT